MAPTLEEQLQAGDVGRDLIDLLCVQDGLTLSTFSLLALSLAELTDRMHTLAEELARELTRKEVVCLRQIWTQLNPAGPSPATPVASQASDMQPASLQSWADTFPPKLTAAVLKQMRLDFESSYPSEILDHETMPGPRLLALTHPLSIIQA